MADASIIDIGGIQWDVKDKDARDRVTSLEEKTSANFDYSAEEKEIGTWIDGKKLYRLIVKGKTTTRRASVSLSDKNINTVTNINGVAIDKNGTVYPTSYYYASNTSEIGQNYVFMYFSDLSKSLFLGFGNSDIFSDVDFIVQIEYTKNE